MFSWRASCGMDHISRRWHRNVLRLSHRHGNVIIQLSCRYGSIWVDSSTWTVSLDSSSTSVNWVRSQRVLHRRHHVYHHCARPSRSCEVHSVAFKSILIDWKCAMILIFTRIDLLSLGQRSWLKEPRFISAHFCVVTHIGAISRRWDRNVLRLSHRHGNAIIQLGCRFGSIWVDSSHLALVPEHDDSVHKKWGVQ